jgi:hypothetical protein
MHYLLLIIIIVIICVFGYLFYIYTRYTREHPVSEKFATNDILYVTDNMYNFKSSLNIDLDAFNTILNNYKTTKELVISDKYNTLSLLIDPYVNYFYLNNTNESNYEIYPIEGIFLYITSTILVKDGCIWDIENKTVAYVFPSDYYFIQAFIKGYKLDINKINLVKFTIEDLLKKDLPPFDVLITYAIPGSTYMKIIEDIRYFLNGFNDVDLDRIKAFYPFLTERYDTLNTFFTKDSMTGYLSNVKAVIPIMNYVVIKNIPVVKDVKEPFITRLEMPDGYIAGKDYKSVGGSNLELITSLYNDREYGCYGNNIINNKFECDSMYNIDGTAKNYYTIWDKKCNVDTDCPFYNKNYSTGGCLKDGFCEMPIGIKRTGFMKYNDEGLNSALCYNCEDTTDLDCCKRSEGKIIAYAYPNDFDRRVEKGLKPVVAPLKYII